MRMTKAAGAGALLMAISVLTPAFAEEVSTPQQRCIGGPEQKCISEREQKAP